eukprot:CAMPEP_0197258830 /NCGR_PEP_ID=MMETSP1429-20130617/83204_1 /TAXON_ID=49237 /ORGANISM="Chaetoceros  sp., Strain UNC1202" /LENGTH=67 /DNA_ID=CAMNT_0042723017 /DNA_START=244 /DNA_END=447 /DNA_ORIENTATION=+
MDHPISRASASFDGEGLGSTLSAEVARKAGAGEKAAAEATRVAMITFCNVKKQERKDGVRYTAWKQE